MTVRRHARGRVGIVPASTIRIVERLPFVVLLATVVSWCSACSAPATKSGAAHRSGSSPAESTLATSSRLVPVAMRHVVYDTPFAITPLGDPGRGTIEWVVYEDRTIEEWHDPEGPTPPYLAGEGKLPKRLVTDAFANRDSWTGDSPERADAFAAARSFVIRNDERGPIPVPPAAIAEVDELIALQMIGRFETTAELAGAWNERLDAIEAERGRGALIDVCRAGIRLDDERIATLCAKRLQWDELDGWESARVVMLSFDGLASIDSDTFQELRSMLGSRELEAYYRYFPKPPLGKVAGTSAVGDLHRQTRAAQLDALDALWQRKQGDVSDEAGANSRLVLDHVADPTVLLRDLHAVHRYMEESPTLPTARELFQWNLETFWLAGEETLQEWHYGFQDVRLFDTWRFTRDDVAILLRVAERFARESHPELLGRAARAMRHLDDPETERVLQSVVDGSILPDGNIREWREWTPSGLGVAGQCARAALAARGDRAAARALEQDARSSLDALAAQAAANIVLADGDEDDAYDPRSISELPLALWIEHDPIRALGAFGDLLLDPRGVPLRRTDEAIDEHLTCEPQSDSTRCRACAAREALLYHLDQSVDLRSEYRLDWPAAAFRALEARAATTDADPMTLLRIAKTAPWCDTRRLVEAASRRLAEVARGERDSPEFAHALLGSRWTLDEALALVEAYDVDRLRQILRDFADHESDLLAAFGRLALLRLGDPASGARLLRWLVSIDFDADRIAEGLANSIEVDGYFTDITEWTESSLHALLARSASPEVEAYLRERTRELAAWSPIDEDSREWNDARAREFYRVWDAALGLCVLEGLPDVQASPLLLEESLYLDTPLDLRAVRERAKRILEEGAMSVWLDELETELAADVDDESHVRGIAYESHTTIDDSRYRELLQRVRVDRERGGYVDATAMLAALGDPGARREIRAALDAGRYGWMLNTFAGSPMSFLVDDVSEMIPFWIEELQGSCCVAGTAETLFTIDFDLDLVGTVHGRHGETPYEQMKRWWAAHEGAQFVRCRFARGKFIGLIP